jgi:CMP-N-acetylneuraminic acid synthetase
MDDTIALIPARGGSKGLRRKNTVDLCGKPLIAWTIEAALKATSLTGVFVTTEDEEIADIAASYGATVIARPAELSTDDARTEEVVAHALDAIETLGLGALYFALLQPTSPLRDEQHIDELVASAMKSGASCAWSVVPAEHHPFKMLVRRDGELRPVVSVDELSAPRQRLPAAFRQNGAIYWMSWEAFRRHRTFFVPPVHPYEMSEEQSVDIDTAADLDACQQLLESGRR